MPTYSVTLNSASSAEPSASVPRRARISERSAKAPITIPAGTNFVPSHGSSPSRAKHPNAARRDTLSSSRAASSAAPASAAAAVISG